MNGFDVSFSTESKVPTWDPLFRPKGNNSRKWWDPVPSATDANSYGTAYWNERGQSIPENTEGANSRVIMDRAIPFIRMATKAKQPFFSIIWFHTPHLQLRQRLHDRHGRQGGVAAERHVARGGRRDGGGVVLSAA